MAVLVFSRQPFRLWPAFQGAGRAGQRLPPPRPGQGPRQLRVPGERALERPGRQPLHRGPGGRGVARGDRGVSGGGLWVGTRFLFFRHPKRGVQCSKRGSWGASRDLEEVLALLTTCLFELSVQRPGQRDPVAQLARWTTPIPWKARWPTAGTCTGGIRRKKHVSGWKVFNFSRGLGKVLS